MFTKLLGLNLSISLTYRGEMFLWQIGTLLIPMISLFVWRAAIVSGAELPTNVEYLTSYFVLVAVVSMLTSSWSAFYTAEAIRDGGLNRFLSRPLPIQLWMLANNTGEKVVKLTMLAPMVAVLAFTMRERFQLPTGPDRWALAVGSLIVASCMRLLLDIMLGALAFWFADVSGFLRASAVIVPLLSGSVIPLALLPEAFSQITVVQPFRYIVSFPLELVLDDVSGGIATGFGYQVGWLIIFGAGALAVWRLGVRAYSGTGA